MKREDLEKLGLTKEQIDTIMAENGKDIEAEKAKAAAKEGEISTANETIKTLQDTVKKFDGVDVEKLKNDLVGLQNKYDADLSAARLDGALEAALRDAKAKNTKAVRALLKVEEIKLDGDKLLGLDKQLEKVKTEASYLFDTEAPGKSGVKVDSGAGHQDPPATGPQSLKEAIAEKLTSKGD